MTITLPPSRFGDGVFIRKVLAVQSATTKSTSTPVRNRDICPGDPWRGLCPSSVGLEEPGVVTGAPLPQEVGSLATFPAHTEEIPVFPIEKMELCYSQ